MDSVITTLSSVTMATLSMIASKVKTLIVSPKIHKPRQAPIKLTGSVTAGTIVALMFPKKR